jgi:hypothetical protein
VKWALGKSLDEKNAGSEKSLKNHAFLDDSNPAMTPARYTVNPVSQKQSICSKKYAKITSRSSRPFANT